MQQSHRPLWPQILVSLMLTALATGAVLRWTWQEGSWRALQSFDLRWLLAALALVLAAWVADVARLQAMGRALGYRIPARVALQTNLMGYFLAAVTPFTVGGGPLQIFSLFRAGLPAGHAAAVVMGSGFIAHLSLAWLGMALVFGFGLTISADPRLNDIVRWLLLAYTIGLMILTWLLWHVERGRRLIGALARGVLGLFGHRQRAAARAAAVERAVAEMGQGLRALAGRHAAWALAAAAAYQLYFLAWFSTVPALAAGLGARPPYWHVVAVQVPIYLLGSIIPTPGGSGGLELGMAGGLLGHVPDYEIGIVVAAWRVLTYYLVLAVGGLAVFNFARGNVGQGAAPVGGGVSQGAPPPGAPAPRRPLRAGSETAPVPPMSPDLD